MKTKFFIPSLLVVAMSVLLFSCSKDTYAPTSSQDDIDDVVEILSMTSTPDSNGNCGSGHHHYQEVDIDSLPTTITDYVDTTFPGGTIHRAVVDDSSNYILKVSDSSGNKYILVFDSAGNLISQTAYTHSHGHGNSIDSSSLPTSVINYIDSNHTGSTITKAFQKSDGSYIVIILQPDGTYLGLLFDSSGNYVSTVTIKDKHGKGKGKGHGKGKGKGKGHGKGKP